MLIFSFLKELIDNNISYLLASKLYKLELTIKLKNKTLLLHLSINVQKTNRFIYLEKINGE